MKRLSARLATLLGLVAILAIGVVLGSAALLDHPGSGPAGAPVARAGDTSQGFEAFTDLANRTYFWIGVDPSNAALYGHFVFYVEGVGTFMPGTLASVDPKSDNSVVITYSGSGSVDRSAKMNLDLARSLVAGTPQPADVQLQAQINPDHHTASAQPWSGGVTYKLVTVRPAANPAATAGTIAGLIQTQNWSALYDLLDSSYRALVSRDQWVAEESTGMASWLGDASITSVTVSSVSAPVEDPGYWSATFSLVLTAQGPSGTRTRQSSGVLILEAGGWRFFTGRAPQ